MELKAIIGGNPKRVNSKRRLQSVLRGFLVGVTYLYQHRLGQAPADELDAEGQALAVQSGGQGNSGRSAEIGWYGEPSQVHSSSSIGP